MLAPPALKNTALGFITIMALLMALTVQPLVGQWSDRTRSRWGKRAPYLVAGAAGVSLALVIIVTADSLWLLVVGAMLVSTFSNTTQSPWQALIPDETPETQHGAAAGIKTVLEVVGAVSGVVLAGFTLARGYLWGAPLVAITLFWIILVITLLTLFRSGQTPHPAGQTNAPNPVRQLAHALKHAPHPFYWWMMNRFLFWSAAIAIRTFMLNYLGDVMGLAPAEAHALGSRLFLVLGAGVFLLALPAGAIADRVGRRPILIIAGLLASLGTATFILWPGLTMLYAAGALVAVGAGIFASASWALATDLAPKNEGALYLGLANAATVLGSIGGRLGGPVIDGVNQLFQNLTPGYLVVFGIAALFFAASSVMALKMPK